MTTYQYRPQGVCSQMIEIDLTDDGIINHIGFYGGCQGNLKAISKLVEGKHVDEVHDLLRGLTCGAKATSCGDQLAIALKEAQSTKE